MTAKTIKSVVVMFAFTDLVVWVTSARLAVIGNVLAVKVDATMSA